MPTQLRYGLWAVAGLITIALVFFLASNLALVFLRSHDGQLHFLTIFDLLSSSSEQQRGTARLALIVTCGAALFGAGAIWKAQSSKALHGTARFATEAEIRKAGLRATKGIIVGKLRGKYLIFCGSEHVIVYAPTRGGKGVGVVIPNLLNWADSAIVLDIKKENWDLTAGFRKQAGQEVYLFDPFDPDGKTARYNPLAYVNRANATDLYDDLQRIAGMLFPIEGRTVDPFWTESARTAFIAVAGYIAETPELPFTIGEVLRQIAAAPDISKHFKSILEKRNEDRPLSQQCRTAMNDFLASSENTLQSVRKSVSAKLGLWLNARIDAATSANDFDLRELRRRPISIYLGVTPDNLDRMAPLLNLFFQQAVDLNTRVLPDQDKSLKRQLMLMMDEFRALGNVEIIAKGVSYVAGFGIRIVTIVQSPSQIREVYGPDAALNYMTNHGVEVVFTPKEHTIATELSERFGYDTVTGRTRSRGLGFSRSSRTESTSDQRRALMLPQELVLTQFEEEYLLKGGIPPVKAQKILYWKDPVFKKRLLPPPALSLKAQVNDARIDVLERQVATLRKALHERIVREPTVEEITAPTQPADGEDGMVWEMPDGTAVDLNFEGIDLSDDTSVNQQNAEQRVSAFFSELLDEGLKAAR
ncbi:type IV secretory system conjugative DNA transfer family protein [Agrobacterium pusense]|jgi:type IV secretion system protein VirD4|uniref:Type IV secretory system conjugative DNA transfer family protein n=1 Tax=Agrobacterium pusense TaxID=648995 RepID=A0AA44IX79_9HYPH|nr:type IV secretory system conjugative DNA transfer family protein [Agrobacterium pusense]NRF07770.1 type IV secretory system conjugative DNA transfer family protein [Agrobacterium pusense]NRF18067.1 type IV secretory system conjugative DNA transfer family protein [Agrobacterium pusense]PZU78339.1 MAG: type IV secretion system protein VirD4 [Rhizobium sp.]